MLTMTIYLEKHYKKISNVSTYRDFFGKDSFKGK